MLGPHSEPVLHDLAVLAADYESYVSKGFVRGRFAVVQKLNTNAPQAADCSCTKLDNPPLTRPLPFPGILPGHGGSIAFRPGHDNRIALAGRAPKPLS